MQRSYKFKQEIYSIHEEGGGRKSKNELHSHLSDMKKMLTPVMASADLSSQLGTLFDRDEGWSTKTGYHHHARSSGMNSILNPLFDSSQDETIGWNNGSQLLQVKKDEHHASGALTMLAPSVDSMKISRQHMVLNGRRNMVHKNGMILDSGCHQINEDVWQGTQKLLQAMKDKNQASEALTMVTPSVGSSNFSSQKMVANEGQGTWQGDLGMFGLQRKFGDTPMVNTEVYESFEQVRAPAVMKKVEVVKYETSSRGNGGHQVYQVIDGGVNRQFKNQVDWERGF